MPDGVPPAPQRARKDATAKVSGNANYTADVRLPGMLHAKVLRSPHPHARIVRVDTTAARSVAGVHAVLTGADLADVATTGWYIKDQPVVAIDRVRYVGDVVAAVAAETEQAALQALATIEVEYAPLPELATVDDALSPGAVELFPDPPPGGVPGYGTGTRGLLRPRPNVCFAFEYRTGSEEVWETCDHVFDDTFTFSRMQHFHLEPFVSVARSEPDRTEVWTSTQNPFPLRKELARMLGEAESRLSVHVPLVGGGFGAKNHPRTEPIAILLSRMCAGRPVRYCLTTEEAFLTNSQHAAVLRLRTGVRADGTFVARDSEILLHAGAYADASPLVAEKVGYRMPGAYRWDHIATTASCVLTNTTPAGAYRGFGGTQATWASESQVDMIARRLGLDPYDLRVQNAKRLGEPFVPHESGIDSDLVQGLDAVADAVDYHRARPANQGVGLAIGLKDGGGVGKPARARVKIAADGAVFLQCGTVEIGQGAFTALSQIAADILSTDVDRVHYAPIDTDHTPYDQGTNASSGVVVTGRAVQRAAEAARDEVLAFAAEHLGHAPEELELRDWTVHHGTERHPLPELVAAHFGPLGFEFTGEGFFKPPVNEEAALESQAMFWEIGWAAAEVTVDPDTGQVLVDSLVVSGDAGRAMHHQACRGQDEGAALMGLGQALFEEMRYDGTRLVNGEALDYRVPLAEDLPSSFLSLLQEQGHGAGPFGSKGMGEGTMLPVAAAVANAVHDATGARVTDLPLTSERVLDALDHVAEPFMQ